MFPHPTATLLPRPQLPRVDDLSQSFHRRPHVDAGLSQLAAYLFVCQAFGVCQEVEKPIPSRVTVFG
jgi:hypothetical protein